jgi:glyoxylase-like metal-dependent hydrolase (beta-lactamase superfamily II)
MASVVTIETPELGDRSYLISDGRAAVVVDPQRDIDRVLATAEEAGVRVALVAETHLHNDYVSGGRELAERTGAEHVIGGGEEVAFPCRPAVEGEAHHRPRELRRRGGRAAGGGVHRRLPPLWHRWADRPGLPGAHR